MVSGGIFKLIRKSNRVELDKLVRRREPFSWTLLMYNQFVASGFWKACAKNDPKLRCALRVGQE